MVRTYTQEQKDKKKEYCKKYYHQERTPEEQDAFKEKRRQYQRDFRARQKLRFKEDPEYEKKYREDSRERATKAYWKWKEQLDKTGMTVYGYYHQNDPDYKSKIQRRKEYEQKQKMKKTKKVKPCERLTINKGKFVVTMD